MSVLIPRYDESSLVNLVAEVEHRLTGSSAAPRLGPALRDHIPAEPTYVLVLIDGLGAGQLGHPAASRLAADHRFTIDAPFPTQTAVVTSTFASGLPPSRHGLTGYLMHLPGVGIINSLFWFPVGGREPLDLDPASFLPAPNTAERLARSGREVVVIEPSALVDTAIDRVLYRGSRVRGVPDEETAIVAALEEAASPGQLVVVYLPHVDAAAHVAGQGSDLYADALATVADVWAGLAEGLPPGAALMGTADHGHVDIPPAALVAVPASPGVAIGGDSRVMQLFGALPDVERLVDGLPGTLVERPDTDGLWGPGPFHPEFSARTPDALFLADAGSAFRFEGHDDPMVGHHGGLTAAEVEVPVLVSGA